MTFIDYPGHSVALLAILGGLALTFAGFYAAELRTARRNAYRWLLMGLQCAVLLLLLLISWNPSHQQTITLYERNTVLTVFDTSQSMSMPEDRWGTRLDQAVDCFTKYFHRRHSEGPAYTIYGFDRYAYPCISSDHLRRWGDETDLNAICALSPEQDTLAGVVIFTDGQVRDRNPRNYPALLWQDQPVLVVGVGSEVPPVDVAVTSVSAPARVWAETAYPTTVTVTSNRIPSRAVTVELLCDGTTLDRLEVTPEQFAGTRGQATASAPKTLEVKVAFMVPAQPLGAHMLSARATLDRTELNAANNVRDTAVEVTQEETLDVLLYSQWATFDIGKIRQALAWSKRINLDLAFDVIKDSTLSDRGGRSAGYVRLPQDAEAFYAYDIVILGPCDLRQLTPTQLEGLYSFVAERGGGLILLPGPAVTSLAAWRDNKGGALLPVLLDDQQTRLWPPIAEKIDITFEGEIAGLFDPRRFEGQELLISPYYNVTRAKPAAVTVAAIQEQPLITMHRLGRGHICLLNASKLFMLYREDRQGGLLSELILSLVTHLGRTPARGAGVELFAERVADDPKRLRFSACVLDKTFKPVHEGNVLLTFADRVVSMEPIGQGYYCTEIDGVLSESVVARVQAESNGLFLGERTIATSLPPVQDEMSQTALDEDFLRGLAQQFGGAYVHIDEIDDRTAAVFVPRQQAGTKQTTVSAWPRWPLWLVLCLLLSVKWFMRRAIGLV